MHNQFTIKIFISFSIRPDIIYTKNQILHPILHLPAQISHSRDVDISLQILLDTKTIFILKYSKRRRE